MFKRFLTSRRSSASRRSRKTTRPIQFESLQERKLFAGLGCDDGDVIVIQKGGEEDRRDPMPDAETRKDDEITIDKGGEDRRSGGTLGGGKDK